jgi:hypothetical protein
MARSPTWTRGEKRRGVCIAHVAVGGGERGGKRRVRGGWRLLKRRQGRGGGPGFSAVWRGKRRRVQGSATLIGTARTQRLWAALIAAGGARLTGAAGVGCEQGRMAACATRNGAADRWGRATSEPSGSGRVRAEVQSSKAARRGVLTGGPDSTVPPGSVLNQFKRIQNSSNFD